MDELSLRYPKELFARWHTGELPEQWYSEYPQLFKEPDLNIARSQCRFNIHFGEWFTAIYYWTSGYEVLIEKYKFPGKHPQDFEKMKALLRRSELVSMLLKGPCQPPDLLVYQTDLSRFFFAEVKRESDHLRPVQREFFQEIQEVSQCKVVIVNLNEA